MKKIAFVIGSFRMGGIEAINKEITEMLCTKHQVHLVNFTGESEYMMPDEGVKSFFIPKN
ncbi:hypothetical protein [Listeria cornellensis]|uniref:Uncharacterized protein n=1 Tax=Listeria cornellensis FSL F6-0969 TaxID=1265820 RepID=W7CBS3_9LIST|nr:hypothetical protein [Listeria cornellensis]EUJ30218.1 hypothetical protein PCORN_08937 [Listeria cornellensis FSL F6-0969]